MRRVTLPAMPLPPEEWDRLADEYEAKARAAVEAGDVEGAAREARRARAARGVARELRGEGEEARLTVKREGATPETVMSPDHRAALSDSLLGKDANMRAARAAGIPSSRALAKKLDVSPQFLSQVRKGVRKMPDDKAAIFKQLTGKDWK